jgi:AcrR family transcriptional regulator
MNHLKQDKYHHGDLRQSLIVNASELIKAGGVEALSMRKLGELVGVSRTALYHHFKNKNELLSAVAESGFLVWQQKFEGLLNVEQSNSELLREYVTGYFEFALANPELYELMFGKTIWSTDVSTDSLHRVAYGAFQFHVELISNWQQKGLVKKNAKALRLAQVTWGTLHGLSKLFMDGVYVDRKNLDEMCETLIALLKNE